MANFMPGEWDLMKGGNTQDVSGIPADDTMAQLLLKRRLAQADALRQQQMPEGQMVSGHYVAPNWMQQLSAFGNQLIGKRQEEQALKGYGDYLGQQRKTKQGAMTALAKALEPQAETQQGTYDIQVPNGKTPTPNDNLGGMQPYESGMKTIQVPMTTTTGTRQPNQSEILNALSAYANATNNPELGEKLMLNRATTLMTPDKYNIHNVGDTGYVINERTGKPTGEKLMGTPKPIVPTTRTFRVGDKDVTQQWNPTTQQWDKVAEGAAFKPDKPEPDPWHLNTPNIATKNAKGWTLHTDKNGNMAYVSPDGKSFEEVK